MRLKPWSRWLAVILFGAATILYLVNFIRSGNSLAELLTSAGAVILLLTTKES